MSSHPGPATSSSDINRSSGCLSLKSGKIFEEGDLWWRHGTAACLTHKNRSRSPILERSFINYLLIIFIIIYFMVLSFSLSLSFFRSRFRALSVFVHSQLAPGIMCGVMWCFMHPIFHEKLWPRGQSVRPQNPQTWCHFRNLSGSSDRRCWPYALSQARGKWLVRFACSFAPILSDLSEELRAQKLFKHC